MSPRPTPRARHPHRTRTAAAVVSAALVALAAAACSPARATDDSTLDVVASFYPLQYVVEQVGGEHVAVASLVPPGGEPHDLEISPHKVRELRDADLVVYLSGLQPAADEAVATRDQEHVVDAAVGAGVGPGGDGSGARDPHFWLDPTLLAAVGSHVADALAGADPEHADDYAAAADRLAGELATLDTELADGLAACAGATLVTSHEAFGYLADRYGLVQVGISGLDPEVEPSPARLRDVGEVVATSGVRTLFFERSAGPGLAAALAEELGVGTAVLDPLETQPPGESDAEPDYPAVMRSNLAALRSGLACG
ncbi:metal ABC transporter substrate-binding protein [Cellulomonas cellasea]|uniref:ABC transporter substrate-binding protein n=2 Tax=Cellulomonas cellasea TaxID=43670 RepID=A0A0A0BBN9_9CELL|nr:metal ABC transporter substrate-binding protein [Cellulomonas cellasea]KGM03482.1 ABC transporter substrate-binding protein [Cellulomonas cellasea DSM 20118]GEA87101.1 zinc ABC transporter substrate-binding protein [Cellulomonas cellasea]